MALAVILTRCAPYSVSSKAGGFLHGVITLLTPFSAKEDIQEAKDTAAKMESDIKEAQAKRAEAVKK